MLALKYHLRRCLELRGPIIVPEFHIGSPSMATWGPRGILPVITHLQIYIDNYRFGFRMIQI
jgi:hypothetical protein